MKCDMCRQHKQSDYSRAEIGHRPKILGARDLNDEDERLIFLAAYSALAYSSRPITADSPRKVSIGPPSLHESG